MRPVLWLPGGDTGGRMFDFDPAGIVRRFVTGTE